MNTTSQVFFITFSGLLLVTATAYAGAILAAFL